MLRNVDGVFVMYCTYIHMYSTCIHSYIRSWKVPLAGALEILFLVLYEMGRENWAVGQNNRSSHWPGSAPRLAQTPCNWPGGWGLVDQEIRSW